MNENSASRPSRSEFGCLSAPRVVKKLLNGGYFWRILNWFNPQQQQYRYSITIKLKHIRPSSYSCCKQNNTTENSGYDFIHGHVISVAFCSMFLNKKTKKLPQSVLCGYFVHHFFLKVVSISFFKNESLRVRANATHWIHNLQNPLYR